MEHGATSETCRYIPDKSIFIRPFDKCNFDLALNWISWIESPDGTRYQCSHGANIIVSSEALAILSLATNDRMTPQRLWKMSMCEGRPIEGACWRSFVGIDYYGNIRDPRTEFLDETPGFPGYMWAGYDESTMQELEELGDSEIIRHKIILEGKFWVWMNPDRYEVSTSHLFIINFYSSNCQFSRRYNLIG